MGKIIASYLVKVHLHVSEEVPAEAGVDQKAEIEALTNDDVRGAIVAGLGEKLGTDVTVSLIERTDD